MNEYNQASLYKLSKNSSLANGRTVIWIQAWWIQKGLLLLSFILHNIFSDLFVAFISSS